MKSEKPVLLTGIKPSGELHIGNYFGAIQPLVELAKSGKYEVIVFLADYHALNTTQDAETMRAQIHDLATAYIACGLEPRNTILFQQSAVPEHTELAWIFDTITTMPYLMRAHAFKDAEAKNKEIRVGTFNYPMLMAADILLYDADLVPVGQDQKQHIEYARDTAEKFNRVFKEDIFKMPDPHILVEVAAVPGTDGQKMSKSYGNVIPLFASKDELVRRVMSIVTDSSGERPENVYAIHALVRSEAELAPLYEEKRGNYKALKEALVEDLYHYLAPMRIAHEVIERDPGLVEATLAEGKSRAREISEAKMSRVRKAIGVA